MTNADKIRNMTDDELVSLLVWGITFNATLEVPSCDEGCEEYCAGCANNCPHEKQERAVREWLKERDENEQ